MAPFTVATGGPSPGLLPAVRECRQRYIKYILDNCPQLIDSRDPETGENVLTIALRIEDSKKRFWAFKYLIAKGANCMHIDKATGRDVLTWTCYYNREEEMDYLLHCCHGDINLQRRDIHGKGILHYCVYANNMSMLTKITNLYVKYGLSVDILDNQGFTPYMQAVRSGYYDCASLLKSKGMASPFKFDTTSYCDIQEWDRIGAMERQTREEEELKRKISMYKMLGRLPQLLKSKFNLKNVKIVESARDKKLLSKDGGQRTRRHTAPPSLPPLVLNDKKAVPIKSKEVKEKRKKPSKSIKFLDTSLPVIAEKSESNLGAATDRSSETVLSKSDSKPVRKGNSLPPIPTYLNNREFTYFEINQSPPDKLCISENLHNIMNMVADVKSSAYRQPRPRTRVKKEPPALNKAQQNLQKKIQGRFPAVAKATVGSIVLARRRKLTIPGEASSGKQKSRRTGQVDAPTQQKLQPV